MKDITQSRLACSLGPIIAAILVVVLSGQSRLLLAMFALSALCVTSPCFLLWYELLRMSKYHASRLLVLCLIAFYIVLTVVTWTIVHPLAVGYIPMLGPFIAVTLWILSIVAMLVASTMIVWLQRRKSEMRHLLRLCAQCGYPIIHGNGARCPECGYIYQKHDTIA